MTKVHRTGTYDTVPLILFITVVTASKLVASQRQSFGPYVKLDILRTRRCLKQLQLPLDQRCFSVKLLSILEKSLERVFVHFNLLPFENHEM